MTVYSRPYHIISVNDARKKNVDNVKQVLDKGNLVSKFQTIKSFNSSDDADVEEFQKLYPAFDLSQYLVSPMYPTQPNRKRGEIGVWMSHFHAWNHLVNNNLDSLLILEDDVYMDATALESINVVTSSCALMILGHWAEAVYVSLPMATVFVNTAYEDGFKTMPVDEYLMLHVRLSGMTGFPCGKFPITHQLVDQYGSDIQDSGKSL
jgi:GR25 family glycosyltransferase involved in LPS biosynthesis